MLIEYCVQFDPIFDHVSYKGVPDIRIIVFLGYPVMAMIRLPTRLSDGKANLHQGAIGVGIDIPTGLTRRGVWGIPRSSANTRIPNTASWGCRSRAGTSCCTSAARAYELCGLGYVGVDLVLDKNLGPLILELNARPGLAIQIANGNGALHRLRKVQELERNGQLSKDPAERVAFAKANFPTT
jgi:alpha-L-glutamate ligase-like protein